MANKATRCLRHRISAACRRGDDTVSTLRPVRNYHSHQGTMATALTTVTFPTARVKGDGFNSRNLRRNSCQRVYLNQSPEGVTQSLTVHEPFVKHLAMLFPNHRQYANWEYHPSRGQVAG
jgi:hypothetical protein